MPINYPVKETDPRDSGTLCDSCGERYRVDFNLPDELWERIRERNGGRCDLLCPVCIARRIERLGEFDYFDLVKLDKLNAQHSAPRKKPRRAQIADELREGDLSARGADRHDIIYGPSDSLPGGEHVVLMGAAKKRG